MSNNESSLVEVLPDVFLKHADLEPLPGNREGGSGMSSQAIGELADSIAALGIVQSLVVRTHPDKKGKYQIVAGVRRWTACDPKNTDIKKETRDAIAALPGIRCQVRECSDADALELRAVENLQRADLNILEEANSYQQMLELKQPDGSPRYTWETLSKRLGKSQSWMRARVKLLSLPDLAYDALTQGKLSPSVALLLARIPDPKSAHKATCEVLDRYQGKEAHALNKDVEPMSYRHAKEHISSKYMQRLKGHPFDQKDDTLVPAQWTVRCGETEVLITSLKPPIVPPERKVHVTSGTQPDENGRDRIVWSVACGMPGDAAYKLVLEYVARPMAEAYAILINAAGDAPVTVERIAGGRCEDCPFRTGNMKALFPDVESADVCTNLPCLKRKGEAHQKREAAKFAEKGQTLLKPKQAAQVLNYEGTALSSGARDAYIPLNEKVPGKKITFGELLQKQGIEHEVVVAKGKTTIPLAPISEPLVTALNKAGVEMKLPDNKPKSKEEIERQIREGQTRRMIIGHARPLAAAALAKAIRLAKHGETVRAAALVSALEHSAAPITATQARKLDDREAFARLFEELVNYDPFTYQGELSPEAIKFYHQFGVDLKSIVKEAEQAVAAQDKQAEAKPEKKK